MGWAIVAGIAICGLMVVVATVLLVREPRSELQAQSNRLRLLLVTRDNAALRQFIDKHDSS